VKFIVIESSNSEILYADLESLTFENMNKYFPALENVHYKMKDSIEEAHNYILDQQNISFSIHGGKSEDRSELVAR
jgi:translation elongation factor P/translation initiation factor 5A